MPVSLSGVTATTLGGHSLTSCWAVARARRAPRKPPQSSRKGRPGNGPAQSGIPAESGRIPLRSGQRPGQNRRNAVISSRPTLRSNDRTPAVAGVLRVELAGLEPATSWVRSRRPAALSLACLRGFRGGGGPVGGLDFGLFPPSPLEIGP